MKKERGTACHKCNQEGHFARECPNAEEGDESKWATDTEFSSFSVIRLCYIQHQVEYTRSKIAPFPHVIFALGPAIVVDALIVPTIVMYLIN